MIDEPTELQNFGLLPQPALSAIDEHKDRRISKVKTWLLYDSSRAFPPWLFVLEKTHAKLAIKIILQRDAPEGFLSHFAVTANW